MSHDELKELVALHALDALEEADVGVVEEHLRVCDTCPDDLASLRETAAWIGRSAEPVPPSPELRAEILAAIDPPPARAGEPAASPRWNPGTVLGGVGLALVTAAIGIYFASMGQRLHRLEVQLAQERAKAGFLAAPETSVVALAGTTAAPSATAKLAWNRKTGRAMLFGHRLPPPPPGHVYQLWYIASGVPIPGTVFVPPPNGSGVWSAEVPSEGRGASNFAVTLEAAGGAPAPAGPMVLTGEF